MGRPLALLPLAGFLLACGGGTTSPSTHRDAGAKDASKPRPLEVAIGTPDPKTGIDFVPLEPGGDIPLQTFGQGGTHATVMVRCTGFGNRAFVDVTVENPDAGTSVMSVPTARAMLLACGDADPEVCDTAPMHVMTGGLADPDKKDGLPVHVTAVVHNDAGKTASASQDGVLRKDF